MKHLLAINVGAERWLDIGPLEELAETSRHSLARGVPVADIPLEWESSVPEGHHASESVSGICQARSVRPEAVSPGELLQLVFRQPPERAAGRRPVNRRANPSVHLAITGAETQAGQNPMTAIRASLDDDEFGADALRAHQAARTW